MVGCGCRVRVISAQKRVFNEVDHVFESRIGRRLPTSRTPYLRLQPPCQRFAPLGRRNRQRGLRILKVCVLLS